MNRLIFSIITFMTLVLSFAPANRLHANDTHQDIAPNSGISSTEDNYADLAIGVNGEDVGPVSDAGAVNVLYGSSIALSATGNQIWDQDSSNIAGGAEPNDIFGYALAAGDFNGDGIADLAIGVPQEDAGSISDSGAVNILYGTLNGLSATGNQIWDQDSSNIEGGAEPNDLFGYALAAGDFNGDGIDDLAIGVPFEDAGSISDSGAVNILYGSSNGLSATGNQIWDQDSSNIEGGAEPNDLFGYALAAGDFNHDGYIDLAIGVPTEDAGSILNSGAVNILYGSASGLSSVNNKIWDQNTADIEGEAEIGDGFGNSLATGDFNNDSFFDLAIGVPGEDVGQIAEAGAVNILYGSANGLNAAGDQIWDQDTSGVEGGAEQSDFFGDALTAGDFNGDGVSDLAIGVPFEDAGSISDSGAVNILYGSSNGLSATGNQFWDQDSPNIEGGAEQSDRFGSALAACDFNGDGFSDLAIGVPFEDAGSISDSGAVSVLYGSSNTLSAIGNQFWDQNSTNIEGEAEASDNFGISLACLSVKRSVKLYYIYLPTVFVR